MPSKARDIPTQLANQEVVTIALYMLGGDTKPVDTEHVAIQTAKLVPGRYSWKHYPDQINIELIRVLLHHAKRSSLLEGAGASGWMLTEKGAQFARSNEARLGFEGSSSKRLDPWVKRERTRLLASDAFQKFHAGAFGDITEREAASFFRIDEYVTGTSRERKITRIVNAFRDDSDLGDAVLRLRDLLTDTVRETTHD